MFLFVQIFTKKKIKKIISINIIKSIRMHTCTRLAVMMILSDHILGNYQTVRIVALLRVCNFLEPQTELRKKIKILVNFGVYNNCRRESFRFQKFRFSRHI